MGGKTIRNVANKVDSLQLQSSARGGVIPYVRGVTSVAPNLVWYNGFKAVPHTETQGGKGGAGGSKTETTTFTYQADLILAVCRGPVIDFRAAWVGKKTYSGGVTGSQIVSTPTETYAVPGSGAMNYTLAHASTLLCVLSVTVPDGSSTRLLAEGRHYAVSLAGVLTVLDASLRGQTLTIASQWRSSTINRTALAALGFSFLAGNIGQSTWSGLAGYSSESIGYSGIAAAAAQAYSLGETAQVENHRFEVVAPLAYHLGSSIPDVDPAAFTRELLVDQRDGASFPSEYLGDWERWSDYCVAAGLLISPALTEQTTAADVVKTAADLTCSAISTSSGKLQIIPRADSPESGNGRTYTPNLTPVYDLDDECYTPSRTGESPVHYRLKSNAQRYNTWSLEYRNRSNGYAPEPADAKDAADIAERGVVANPSTVQAHWICTSGAAAKAVQVMMQRSISVLTEYEVPLPPHYSLIDLCDLLTLTDATLGMDREPVFVIGIDEDADGNLKLLVEDYPIGSASAPTYAAPEGLGYMPDYNADPGDVDAPTIIEGPAQLAGTTGIEVYIATSGSDPDWGGCQVWTSLDGTNYRQVATVYGPARYGALSAAMTSGATSLQVAGLGDALVSGSAADAAQLATLCFVGGSQGEFLAYQTATLTGPGAYTLGGLVRAAYGSPAVSHANGATFVRLDDRVARSGPLDPSMVGQVLYIKCLSFNRYRAALQSLADATAYTYTVTGEPASYNPGVGGKALALRTSALTFQYPKAGGVNPGSITFTAERKGGLLGTVTWSVPTGTATLTGSGDTRTLTAANLTSEVATIRATITDGVGSYIAEATISKLREGTDGATGATGPSGSDAPLLVLLTTAQTFTFNGANVATPTSQTITFTLALQNVSGTATWACTLFDASGSSIGTPTLGGSGNTRTLTIAQFGAAVYAEVTATLGSLSDLTRLVRLRDGAASIVSDLTNDALTLPSDASGNVTSFAGAATTMVVYNGLTDDSANWTFSRSNSSGITSSISGATVTVTAMAAGTDAGYVDITATRSGYPTQTKRFTISKSRSAGGSSGVLGGQLFGVGGGGPAPATYYAGVQFGTDGEIRKRGNTSTSYVSFSPPRYWVTPAGSGVGTGRYIRFHQESGDAPDTTPTPDVWVALSTDRAVSFTCTSGQLKEGVWTYEISSTNNASGTEGGGRLSIWGESAF